MTDLELFQILRPHIMTVTGVPECILADPNAQAPLGEYASVRPTQAVRMRGQANIYTSNQPGNLVRTDVRAQIIADCDVNFYRGSALARARSLMECHKRPDVAWDLFRHKIGWGGTEAVNNLTALQASNFEQRAQITIRLMYETSSIVDINNILSASAVVQNENGQTLQSVAVNLDVL